MKTESREKIKCEINAYVDRILKGYISRPITGSITFEVNLSQGGLSTLDAKFTERLK